ncbi:hypothetical protein ILYODFUR_019417 [Ilyodon furcidens]|uniref:XK-related protein n=1 Tax=Ilyodon furcidens TaxID=33524 RepID=A0ABV0SZT6_9TELE
MTTIQLSDMWYSKWRWLLNLGGLFMYIGDICTDTALAFRYFQEAQYVWSGMTALFIITGLVINQIFSYAWFSDNMEDKQEQVMICRSKGRLLALHVFGMGIFLRYYHLLRQGYRVVWRASSSDNANFQERHHELFCMATDLSMLKLFESFLESAPQLLLQLYIWQGHDEWFILQYLSLVFSFFNLAWSLVDYRSCLRRSLPHIRGLPSGPPTVVYLLYKLFTITSLTLSYSLLLTLSVYTTVGLTVFWLLGTIWAHLLQTNFCTSTALELLYRGIIGAILVFSFFNVKGQNTKLEMIIYYFSCTAINVSTPLMLFFLKPELKAIIFFWSVSGLIYGGSLLGLVSLVWYYHFLHPKRSDLDEVDGLGKETPSARRIRAFIKP